MHSMSTHRYRRSRRYNPRRQRKESVGLCRLETPGARGGGGRRRKCRRRGLSGERNARSAQRGVGVSGVVGACLRVHVVLLMRKTNTKRVMLNAKTWVPVAGRCYGQDVVVCPDMFWGGRVRVGTGTSTAGKRHPGARPTRGPQWAVWCRTLKM